MPELPEVESIRRTLAPLLVGQTVARVRLRRSDYVHGPARPRDLLASRTIVDLDRRGKQLALYASPAGCVCVHLGMSGSLCYVSASAIPAGRLGPVDRHTHVVWRLSDGSALLLRDPRRFGGIWTFADKQELGLHRWDALGPDGLTITNSQLHEQLDRTRRTVKAVLLDQNIIAGIGNIYADESLFAARVHPMTIARTLSVRDVSRITRAIRTVLARAIAAGGSTLRDYRNGDGKPGRFQFRHRVYGRGGQPCMRCKQPLEKLLLTGRATVFCGQCQRINGR
ncbi:MAG: bifunctional DNA-formamidopyrimidine glycosylase/DNA-(apurinic or apyrimidinic site) lyase [Phycisphaeraceae bacterium]|jgi:formamidopyrimidine-DNA glycosylase|nr:bifunctional DNA-formamidopyrimidine glycosylase/DNA-(apurinic or apyrimidinic site) lyase [Phycisphaeraceae bacterium]